MQEQPEAMQKHQEIEVVYFIIIIILIEFCRRVHLSVRVEVGQGLSRVQSNSHPADVLVNAWERAKPAAFDVTVTSPLTPATLHDACSSACSSQSRVPKALFQ